MCFSNKCKTNLSANKYAAGASYEITYRLLQNELQLTVNTIHNKYPEGQTDNHAQTQGSLLIYWTLYSKINSCEPQVPTDLFRTCIRFHIPNHSYTHQQNRVSEQTKKVTYPKSCLMKNHLLKKPDLQKIKLATVNQHYPTAMVELLKWHLSFFHDIFR